MSNRSKRYQARVSALEYLYSVHSGGKLSLDTMDENKDKRYTKNLVTGIGDNQELLEDLLSPLIENTSLSEVVTVDRLVLLIGAYELKFQLDVPWRVVVNEATTLAKEFGSDDGYKLVNAVLDKLSKSLREGERSDGKVS